MVPSKVNLPQVAGWAGSAAGAFNAHTVTVDCPIGPRYKAIWMYGHAGAAKKATDLIGEVRLNINGSSQRTFNLIELLKINALNQGPGDTLAYAGRNGNVAATAFQIPFWFAEPWRKGYGASDAFAWGTGDVGNLQIELDITAYAGAAAGLIAPTFKAVVDNRLVDLGSGRSSRQPLGLITKWRKVSIPITGLNDWNDYLGLRELRGAIQSIHLNDANLSEYELLVDNQIVRKDTFAGNAADLAGNEMSPDPAATNDCPARAMYDLVMDVDDAPGNALPVMIGDRRVDSINLRLKESGGAARNITAVIEYVGPAE